MQRRHLQELHQAAAVSPLAAASTPEAVPALRQYRDPASSHHRNSASTCSVLMQRRHPQELHQAATVPPLAAASTPVAVPALRQAETRRHYITATAPQQPAFSCSCVIPKSFTKQPQSLPWQQHPLLWQFQLCGGAETRRRDITATAPQHAAFLCSGVIPRSFTKQSQSLLWQQHPLLWQFQLCGARRHHITATAPQHAAFSCSGVIPRSFIKQPRSLLWQQHPLLWQFQICSSTETRRRHITAAAPEHAAFSCSGVIPRSFTKQPQSLPWQQHPLLRQFQLCGRPRPGVITSPQQRLNIQRSHAAASSPGASPSSRSLSAGSSIHS